MEKIKKMYWLKFGLAFLAVFLVTAFIVETFCVGFLDCPVGIDEIFEPIVGVILVVGIPVSIFTAEMEMGDLGYVVTLAIYFFVVGSIIGLIVGKNRNKPLTQ